MYVIFINYIFLGMSVIHNLYIFVPGGAFLDASANIIFYVGELMIEICKVCSACIQLISNVILFVYTMVYKSCLLLYTILCMLVYSFAELSLWLGTSVVSLIRKMAHVDRLVHTVEDVLNATTQTIQYDCFRLAIYFRDAVSHVYTLLLSCFASIVYNGNLDLFPTYVKFTFSNCVNYVLHVLSSTGDYLRFIFTYTIDTLSLEIYLFMMIVLLILLVLFFVVDSLQTHGMTFPRIQRERSYIPTEEFSDDAISDSENGVVDISDSDDSSTSSISTNYSQHRFRYSNTNHSDASSDSGDEIDEFEIATDTDTDDSGNETEQIEVNLPSCDISHYSLRQRASITPARGSLCANDLARHLETERDKHKCVVCQDHPKNVLVMPCKHMCLCIDCARSIVGNRNAQRIICPLCRCKITKVMDVFV